MHIVILAGGVGGSRFVRGVRHAHPEATIDVIVNTADDITLHGMRVCPDLDTMMYALGDGIDPDRKWGRNDEGWRIMDELRTYGVEPTWFALGDRDVATHIIRTELMNAGYRLADVTAALCHRWLGPESKIRILPMTEDRVESHVVVDDPEAPSGRRTMHFQEYWVRHRAEPDALEHLLIGIKETSPAPGVTESIAAADLILIAPSNPVVSIGPVLAVPGIRAAIRAAKAPVLGVSGIIGDAPVLGMAHRLLPVIGVEVSAAGVGRHYGHRDSGGLLDGWLVHDTDAGAAEALTAEGLPTVATPLMMDDPAATARFLAVGEELVGRRA
ncbi:MAG: 2-phospho-L-lactate transferase [Propionibacterium sp.]|nr:2-phospho-L-lactate transferase [Propionibacterium sp.]